MLKSYSIIPINEVLNLRFEILIGKAYVTLCLKCTGSNHIKLSTRGTDSQPIFKLVCQLLVIYFVHTQRSNRVVTV